MATDALPAWDDPRFHRLSKPAPNAQTLWLYLLTGPYATTIPGVVRGGRAAIAEALGWNLADFDRCFSELIAGAVATADWDHRLVYFASAERRPGSPNVVLRWRRFLDQLPECSLRDEIERDVRATLLEISPAFLRAFDSNRRGPSRPKSEPKLLMLGSSSEASCNRIDESAPANAEHPYERLPEEDPEKDPEKDHSPPIPPPRDSENQREQLELMRSGPNEPTTLGAPQNRRQRRLVDRWLTESLAVFAELSTARRRVDENLPELRASYESLAGIASRLDSGKTVDECRYVIAVCEAECRRDRASLRYFNAISPFRPENFEMKLAMPLALPPPRPERFQRAPPQSLRALPESIDVVLSRRDAE